MGSFVWGYVLTQKKDFLIQATHFLSFQCYLKHNWTKQKNMKKNEIFFFFFFLAGHC